ncbi:MAG: hypothetical protein AUK44_02500 [Porphyromonadaceae bacterium CG2_30_38_12]|nr:MAG: hypothetical protein AUK44_02500 [Porphyromonadaceae bacterium CG2_30_38_12]
MNHAIKIFVTIVLVTTLFSACKTKQKVTKITGANIEANSTVAPSNNTQQAEVTTVDPSLQPEQELTRNERFTLVDGDGVAGGSLTAKYYVVVGSFKSQMNAKGLQSTLKNEGNKALVVVNEQAMYRVLIASFNDYGDAHKLINQISQRFPDAWVLVQK